MVGLLGPNRAGKTTTLRMLSRPMHPDAGAIRVDDADVVADPIGVQTHLGVFCPTRVRFPFLECQGGSVI